MFLKVGHRGARAYEVENTLESFGKAISLGANAVELDIRSSKEGIPVVSHDDNLKRVFGKDLAISDATVRELKQETGDKLPVLEEVLQFIDRKVDKILLELKETGAEKKVLGIVKKADLKDRVIIVSFLEEALVNVRKLDSKIETGLIYTRFKDPFGAALKMQAQYLVPLYRFVHTKDVEKAHTAGLKVIVWTINTKEEAMKYISKGVDGIATDRPDIFDRTV
jgi:glycerophosphoryl diester phosphodiesterase